MTRSCGAISFAATGAAAASTVLPRRAFPAGKAKIRIGLLLPYSGTYAALGNNITDAMKLAASLPTAWPAG